MKMDTSKALKTITVLLGLTVLFAAGCQMLETKKPATNYSQIKYTKLGDIKMPDIREVTLANGMKLLLLEDHQLPLINIYSRIRTGSVYEDSQKTGLASITLECLRSGGTATKTGEQIDEELELIAADISVNFGFDFGSASLSVLKNNFDNSLAIFADILMNPVFEEDKIELAKIRRRANISRRNDNISRIASSEYDKIIYGPTSPYARQIEYATINSITHDDIVAFYQKYFCPNNFMLAVCGDFNTDDMIKKIDNAFKNWQKSDVQIPPLPQVSYQYRLTVNQVTKNDLNQSRIYIGHIAGLMSDPDYPSLVVMESILGSGFTSRIFRNIRSRMGLAYSASGSFDSQYSHPGIFYVSCQTNSGATVKATKAMLDQVSSMTANEVTDEELKVAKESYLNTFVFNFETKSQVVNQIMTLEYYGYPRDFLFKLKDAIEKVTKEDVLRVAKKHLQPDKVQILVVGKPSDFDQPLTVFGPVNEIDITIPK